MDSIEFLKLAPWKPARVGAYFYDAGHTFEEQFKALAYILPWLANNAVVVVDDTNSSYVRAANRYFTSRAPELQIVKDIRTPKNKYPTWWNGMQVYHYLSGIVMSLSHSLKFPIIFAAIFGMILLFRFYV